MEKLKLGFLRYEESLSKRNEEALHYCAGSLLSAAARHHIYCIQIINKSTKDTRRAKREKKKNHLYVI